MVAEQDTAADVYRSDDRDIEPIGTEFRAGLDPPVALVDDESVTVQETFVMALTGFGGVSY